MEAGADGLEQMLVAAQRDKTYSPEELGKIENAFVNVRPFVEYKRQKGL